MWIKPVKMSFTLNATVAKSLTSTFLLILATCFCAAQPYFVSPSGDDANPGTLERPFATLQRAQQAAREKPRNICLRGGTYYLPETLVFTEQDSGTKDAPVVFENYQDEQPVISGGVRLDGLKWQPFTNGIFQAQVPADLQTEEIFVNGERQILARYPNCDPKAKYFDGFTSGADIQRRATRWANPTAGFLHAMHPALWGDFTWRITGKDANVNLTKVGGWQNNRGGGINEGIQFVENIFEELDSPGEWFLNHKTHTLYFYPPAGLDLSTARRPQFPLCAQAPRPPSAPTSASTLRPCAVSTPRAACDDSLRWAHARPGVLHPDRASLPSLQRARGATPAGLRRPGIRLAA